MSKYGPSSGELKFRIYASLFGMALVLVALLARGITGIASLEIIAIAILFFLGTALRSAWMLYSLRKTRRRP
ncbi:MAG: hypothetical protein AAGA12_06675 [Pseudomonadota bacterium]